MGEAVWWAHGRVRLLPPPIEMHAVAVRSFSISAGCAHARRRVASVSSDVPLSAAVARAENWALIRVLRSGSSAPMAL